MKASHTFNLLDARKAISVTERQRYILRVRTLARAVAQAYYESREALGFPMLKSAAVALMSGAARDFLVELGTEELPPLALPELERAFAAGVRTVSPKRAAPRRAALVRDAAASRGAGARPRGAAAGAGRQAQGPARVSAAFGKAGKPTMAATKFAEKCGVDVNALARVTEGKGEFLFYAGSKPGARYRRACCPASCRSRSTRCRSRSACAGARPAPSSCGRCIGW